MARGRRDDVHLVGVRREPSAHGVMIPRQILRG